MTYREVKVIIKYYINSTINKIDKVMFNIIKVVNYVDSLKDDVVKLI